MTKERFIGLVTRDPFSPFTLRVDGKDIEVSHPRMCAWHPEVREIIVVTREGSHEFLPESVQLVTKSITSS